ncbi:MAG: dihydropteroate synthase [Eubacteriales bacterium]|nr:dihydropteroate synthase [Eubacteriales bacterium]
MKIGDREFKTAGHTYVMGILNVTPDSFSDGGRWNELDAARKHVARMLDEGADIIDVGGESTRPGYTLLSDEEETGRIVPVISMIKSEFGVPVSADTYKSAVAASAIEAGADLVNDIRGLKYDPELAGVIAASGVPCCLMHNRNDKAYNDFMQDMLSDLRETIDIAHKAGIADDRVILDPGVGFGKSYENNLTAIKRMDELKALGYPLLLGTSRKSVIGLTLDLPSDERIEGTLVTTVFAVMHGAMFVRVHDIKENVRAIKMTEAILRG